MVEDDPPGPRARGNAFAASLSYLRTNYGEAGLERVLAAVQDREGARLLAAGVRRNAWYPFALLMDYYEALERVMGDGDGSLALNMNRVLARDDLGTILKAFITIFAHPHDIVQRASLLWHTYYDAGELVLASETPRSVHLEVRNFPAPHRLHCASILGWMTGCIEVTRVESPSVKHPRCRAEGGPVCEFVATWC
jgi:hypothetical protein